MWKTVQIGKRILGQAKSVSRARRTFLSEAYQCREAWDRRLQSPIIKKIDPSLFFNELDQKLQTVGKCSGIDVDIFANAIITDEQLEELMNIVYRVRLTPEASNVLPSTSHAFIRAFLNSPKAGEVVEILHDRLNYGIFPDHFTFNLLMDTFIKQKEFALAANVASLLMLQEDDEHPICNALAVYSCHMFLKNPIGWELPEPEVDDTEEIKIRVPYLRNPYFDDHFDLVEPRHLVGKTLDFFGKKIKDDTTLGRTLRLRGLILFGKYDRLSELIKEWSSQQDGVYEEILELIQKDLDKFTVPEEAEKIEKLKDDLKNLNGASLKKGNLTEIIEKRVKDAIELQAERDISKQCEIYDEWEKTRQSILEAHLDELQKQARLKNVEKIKKDLEERERILTFFEQEEEIELEIEKLESKEEKIDMTSKQARRVFRVDENYVPPQIVKRS
ncbi:28S ribosomal protein S27, mitochondrial [Cephus cinctus]|uniref:28S ribosomal protein S27, mitochondrial n=1 Tax=Cephus cinctus TaxID=211228 RepID=A0AAJ7BXH3_CEPCN|nr:28S ribosomal protein S27, mitochondrial [Cephus cinctus]